MANNNSQINISIKGTNETKGVISNVKKDLQDLNKSASKQTKVNIDTKSAEAGIKNLNKITTDFEKVLGKKYTLSVDTKGAQEGLKGVEKAAGGAAGGLDKTTKSTGMFNNGINTSVNGIRGMNMQLGFAGMALSQVTDLFLQGATASSIFGDMINGAMQQEDRMIKLTAKFGEEGKKVAKVIEEIAVATPGDDTRLKNFLNQVVLDQAVTSYEELNKAAQAFAGYRIASRDTKIISGEAEFEATEYILRGNIGLMQRDGIYKDHLDELNSAKTYQERINVLTKLNAEHYANALLHSDSLSNTWDVIKGTMEQATTQLGADMLPYVKMLAKAVLDVNAATGGWAIKGAIVSGLMIALGGSLVTVVGAFELLGINIVNATTGMVGFNLASGGAAWQLWMVASRAIFAATGYKTQALATFEATAAMQANNIVVAENSAFTLINAETHGMSAAQRVTETLSTLSNTITTKANSAAQFLNSGAVWSTVYARVASAGATIRETIGNAANTASTLLNAGAKVILATATGIATVAAAAFNAVLYANPLVWVAALVIGLGIAIYALATDFGGCRTAIVGWGQDLYNSSETVRIIWDNLVAFGAWLQGGFTQAWDGIVAGASSAGSYIQGAWGNTVSWFSAKGAELQGAVNEAANVVGPVFAEAQSELSAAWGEATSEIGAAWGELQGSLGTAFAEVQGALGEAWNTVSGDVMGALGEIWNTLKAAVQPLIDALFPVTQATEEVTGPVQEAGPSVSLFKQVLDLLVAGLKFILPYFVTGLKVAVMVLTTGIKVAAFVITGFIDIVSWLIGAAGNTITAFINLGIWLWNLPGQIWNIWVGGFRIFVGYLQAAGAYIISLPGRIWSFLVSGFWSFVGAFQGAAAWIWGLPGRIAGWISDRIPKLQWPSVGSILDAIKGALGFRGPPSGLNQSNLSSKVSQMRQAQSFNAQTANKTVGSNIVQQMKATPTVSWRRGPSGPNDLSVSYQNYAGHQKDALVGANRLVGNCVDMTLGMMQLYGGSFALGTYNGGPHMWYVSPQGQHLDPARKALEGTWTPPAKGPGDSVSTIVINGDILDGDHFMKMVEKANIKIIGNASKF